MALKKKFTSISDRKAEDKGSLTLAINATEGRLQMALGISATGVSVWSSEWQASSQGVEILAPALHQALALLHYAPEAIGRIAVVRGPGSFTGLRLAIATAAGLARALGTLQAGIEYLPLLALNALPFIPHKIINSKEPIKDRIVIITHARRELVYTQVFEPYFESASETDLENTQQNILPNLRPISTLEVLNLEDCIKFISDFDSEKRGSSLLLAGSGLYKNSSIFFPMLQEKLAAACILPEIYSTPSLQLLFQAALDLEGTSNICYSKSDIEPLYLRPSDAEDSLESIAIKLGHNPEYSRSRLEELLSVHPASDV